MADFCNQKLRQKGQKLWGFFGESGWEMGYNGGNFFSKLSVKMNEVKQQIYLMIADFLENYKARNTDILADKFDIAGELLDELDEAFDFIVDKSRLRICTIDEMGDELIDNELFDVFEYNDDKSCYGVACALYENKEFIGRINARYYKGNHHPKFLFLGLES